MAKQTIQVREVHRKKTSQGDSARSVFKSKNDKRNKKKYRGQGR